MSGILADLLSVGVRVSLDSDGGVRLSGLTSLPKDEARRILKTVRAEKNNLVEEIHVQRNRHRQWIQDVKTVGAAWDGQSIHFEPFLGIDDAGCRWKTAWSLVRGFVPDIPEK